MLPSMFESYETEFTSIIDEVSSDLGSPDAAQTITPERLQTIEANINKAVKVLRQMEVESRSSGANIKEKKAKVADFGRRLQQLRNTYETIKESAERGQLFGSTEGNTGGEVSDGARRFEQVSDRMDRQTETLLQSKRTLADTEEVAMGITENLASNRQTILSAHEKVHATGGFIGQSQSLLRRMQHRESRRKLILTGLFVFLILVFILILYFAIRGN